MKEQKENISKPGKRDARPDDPPTLTPIHEIITQNMIKNKLYEMIMQVEDSTENDTENEMTTDMCSRPEENINEIFQVIVVTEWRNDQTSP